MKYFTNSVALLALGLICTGGSLAAEIGGNPFFPLDEKSAVVKYSDLNLADAADAQILLHRVENLTKELCKRQSDIRQLNAVRDQQRCVEDSYKKALVAINRQTGIDTEAMAARAAGSREIVGAE